MKKLLMLALLCALTVAISPSRPALAQEDRCAQTGGIYDAERERCIFSAGLDLQIQVPYELMGLSPLIDTAVNEFLAETTTRFFNYFTAGALEYSTPPWILNVAYETYELTPAETTEFSPAVLTIAFSVYEYSGGANGMGYYETLSFDTTNGVPLEFEDVFVEGSLPQLSTLVQGKLATQLGDMSDPEFIALGTGEIADNYRSFALTNEAVIFFFDEYQVAAGAAGPQTLSIPIAEIQDLLQPPFQPLP